MLSFQAFVRGLQKSLFNAKQSLYSSGGVCRIGHVGRPKLKIVLCYEEDCAVVSMNQLHY